MARHITHYIGALIFTIIFTIVIVEPLSTPHKYSKKDTWTVEDSKGYAFNRLSDWRDKQMSCLSKLWGKESAWNPKAIGNLTGTHRVYGIPQGKSEWLKDQDGYTQIQWGLKYIQHHRIYKGDTCKALDHWKAKGWH